MVNAGDLAEPTHLIKQGGGGYVGPILLHCDLSSQITIPNVTIALI